MPIEVFVADEQSDQTVDLTRWSELAERVLADRRHRPARTGWKGMRCGARDRRPGPLLGASVPRSSRRSGGVPDPTHPNIRTPTVWLVQCTT